MLPLNQSILVSRFLTYFLRTEGRAACAIGRALDWRKYVHEVRVNRLGGLRLPRKSVVRLTDRPDMTLDVYRGRKTTMQQQQMRTEDLPPKFILSPNYNLSVFLFFLSYNYESTAVTFTIRIIGNSMALDRRQGYKTLVSKGV